MSDLLEDLDLARDTLDVLLVLDASLLKNFDGNVLLGKNVVRHLDLAERALAQRLAYAKKKRNEQNRNLKAKLFEFEFLFVEKVVTYQLRSGPAWYQRHAGHEPRLLIPRL